jgi:hypothetical protein
MSVGTRIRQEAKEIGLATLFFLAFYTFFLGLKKLILEEYEIEASVFHTAVIGALVTAKVVVILDKTSFGDFFRQGPIWTHVLFRSLAYTLMVVVVTGLERVWELHGEAGSVSGAVAELWKGRSGDHFLAWNLAVVVSFLVYNTYAEIDDHFGPGSLRRLFFSKRSAAPVD